MTPLQEILIKATAELKAKKNLSPAETDAAEDLVDQLDEKGFIEDMEDFEDEEAEEDEEDDSDEEEEDEEDD